MKYFNKALDIDIEHQYENAIKYYHESISKDEREINAYINLAFIYWAAANE